MLRKENETLQQALTQRDEANTELQRENDTLKRELTNTTYYNVSSLQVPHGVWAFALDVLHALNRAHSNFRGVFFDDFRALLKENDDVVFVRRIADYIRLMQSTYMFVRVERPVGSKRFVLAYMKCDWVFSFALRFEQMRVRLNRVPPTMLTKVEVEENKALRLACVGETDYERAVIAAARKKYQGKKAPLCAALRAGDEDAAEALLDGGDDPNEVDGGGRNALCWAAKTGCRLPLFHRILGMIHNVNAGDNRGWTALMMAAESNHLDMVVSLMNHPGIDLNVQDIDNDTALHKAVANDRPAIVSQLLSDDSIDTRLKDNSNYTPWMIAIYYEHVECEKLLREKCGYIIEDGKEELIVNQKLNVYASLNKLQKKGTTSFM